MFKLPNLPSPRASDDELADFAEIMAWQNGFTSATNVARYLGLTDDNIDANGEEYYGCEDQEDEHNEKLETVFELLGERARACGSGYPFGLDQTGSVLRLLEFDEYPSRELYVYLLAATRINMTIHKMVGDVDGALLMEEVCCEAIRYYLGSERAQSIILGTASAGGFQERLRHLIREIKEPCLFRNIDGEDAPVRAQDDGVDVVAWIPFADGAPGKLSIFAQVKTGTSWRDRVYDCQPEAFQTKWLNGRFVAPPIRAFCVAESVSRSLNWNSSCAEVGVLIDRCRIVSSSMLEGFARINDLRSWVAGAKGLIEENLAN
jgi:hypothetical protein